MTYWRFDLMILLSEYFLAKVCYLFSLARCCGGSCPVMVWLHGGGFVFLDGSPKTFGPDILMNFDIVLVNRSA